MSLAKVATSPTARVELRVVAPVTPRVELSVVAPATFRIPPKFVSPLPTVKFFEPVTLVLPLSETLPVPVEIVPVPVWAIEPKD